MGKAAAMVGVTGAIMAFLGSIVGVAVGGAGVSAGADQAGLDILRGFGAMGMSGAGLAGALMAGAHRRWGPAIMIGSTALGLVLAFWSYAVGAVLLAVASYIVLRGDQEDLSGESGK